MGSSFEEKEKLEETVGAGEKERRIIKTIKRIIRARYGASEVNFSLLLIIITLIVVLIDALLLLVIFKKKKE